MPFILKHAETSEVFTCPLINNYDIPFFGTQFWDHLSQAEQEKEAFLQSRLVENPEKWELLEIEEHQLKMFNVKLNNNPVKSLFLDDQGKATVRVSPTNTD
jgi:hypothetical protein